MPIYRCLDGVLQGHVLSWAGPVLPGEVVTVGVVDVAHAPGPDGAPEADYRVVRAPDGGRPGRLTFVAARGSWAAAS